MWKSSVCTKDCPDSCGLLVKVEDGNNVYCGPTIWPNNDQGLEDLAR